MTGALTIAPQHWLEEHRRTDVYDDEASPFRARPHSMTDPGLVGDVNMTIRDIDRVLARMSTMDDSRDVALLVRLVAAWLEGLNFEEIAKLLGFSRQGLTKILHGEVAVQASRSERVIQVAEVVRQLGEIIRPEATGRWFRTYVPDLGTTPFEAICHRRVQAVLDVVRSYSSPSYS